MRGRIVRTIRRTFIYNTIHQHRTAHVALLLPCGFLARRRLALVRVARLKRVLALQLANWRCRRVHRGRRVRGHAARRVNRLVLALARSRPVPAGAERRRARVLRAASEVSVEVDLQITTQ